MKTMKVNGMHCVNCKNAVEKALSSIPGIKSAKVDLDKKEVAYEEVNPAQPVDIKIISEAIDDLGFTPEI